MLVELSSRFKRDQQTQFKKVLPGPCFPACSWWGCRRTFPWFGFTLRPPGPLDGSREAHYSQPRLSRCAGAEGKRSPTWGQATAVGATAGRGCSPLPSPLDGSRQLQGGRNRRVSEIPQMP